MVVAQGVAETGDRACRSRYPFRRISLLARHADRLRIRETAGPIGRGAGLARRLWRPAYFRRLDGRCGARPRLFARERAALPDGVSETRGPGAAGRILGPDRLAGDKFVRTLGFYREAETSFSALSPQAQKRFQAYADGVNAFLESHKNALPPELMLIGDSPEPWKPADTLVLGKLKSLELSDNYEFEALRAHLAAKTPDPNNRPGCFPDAEARGADHNRAQARRYARERRSSQGAAWRPDWHNARSVE